MQFARSFLGCAAFAFAFAPVAQRGVLAAMPVASGRLDCVAKLRDVRAGSFASHYVFEGFYAYGEWNASGARGQSLWDKRGPKWCKIATGNEVLDEAAIERHGVAPETAHALIAKMTGGPAQLAPPVAGHR
jgi:hypothetical protein